MFKNETPKNIKDTETIIGESVMVEGEFNGHGNVIIEGKLNGNLNTDGHVLVGEKAEINANIKASSAFISGLVKGNININDSLDVAKTAIINGDIKAQSIAVEAGCQINGKINIGTNPSKALYEKGNTTKKNKIIVSSESEKMTD
ncbi:polymer-forming cytoskeletal protein [bacterium]|nr:polymer-forming cytoskeletal protein [bacterium]